MYFPQNVVLYVRKRLWVIWSIFKDFFLGCLFPIHCSFQEFIPASQNGLTVSFVFKIVAVRRFWGKPITLSKEKKNAYIFRMPWPPPSLPPQTEDVLDLGGALADLARAARETRTTLWSALQVGLVLVWFDLIWCFLRQHNLLSWIVKLRLAFASWTRNPHESKARLKRLIPKVIPTKKRRRKSQMIKRKRNHILTFFCVQFYHSFV